MAPQITNNGTMNILVITRDRQSYLPLIRRIRVPVRAYVRTTHQKFSRYRNPKQDEYLRKLRTRNFQRIPSAYAQEMDHGI